MASDTANADGLGLTGRILRSWKRIAAGFVLALALYYPVGMAWVHTIDDSPDFAPTEVPPGASRTVALMIGLIDRETVTHAWVANDPFFLPGFMLDNMPEFQQGIVAALARFAVELGDQIARTRGSSQSDPDLERAAGLLKYPGDVWLIDFKTSWLPTASSDSQYLSAARALANYNRRLAAGEATFERRADNLIAVIDRMAADLGSSSAVIDRQIIVGRDAWIDTRADNVFYGVKGRLYAYALIMRELGEDYRQLLKDRDVSSAWAQTLDSFREAAALDPLIVMNGAPDGLFSANHLAVQGFYLLRARIQLREISSILQK
jgi:hypothetical protein